MFLLKVGEDSENSRLYSAKIMRQSGCDYDELRAPFLGGSESLSASSAASGIVAQYRFNTCLSAGLRIGFGKKKFMPESMHSLTLLSSAKAERATMGAENPVSRIRRVLCKPSTVGI